MSSVLVFSGGGTRCLSYLFSLKYLIDKNMINTTIEKIYGTSAGSFIASILALGGIKQIDRVIEIAKKTDFKKALNIDLANILNFSKTFGLDDKSSMRQMVKEILNMIVDEGCELKFKNVPILNVVVADLSDAKTVVLNSISFPEMKIIDGILASMSLPFLYTPSFGLDGHMYIDGGLRANFPWDCLENDKEKERALGFIFQTTDSGVVGTNPSGLQMFIHRLIHFENIHVTLKNKNTWNKNIVFVNMPNYPAYYMNIKNEDLIELENAGILAAKQYIEKNESVITHSDIVETKCIISDSLLKTEEAHLDHERIHHSSLKEVYRLDHTDEKTDTLLYFSLCKSLSLQQHNHISRDGPSGRRWSV